MEIEDRKTYRQMSEPHASKDALNDDLLRFFKAVRALRIEHHLQNVVCVVQSPYLADGEEGIGTAIQNHGDRVEAQSMCAYAYGVLRSEHSDNLAKMLKGK